MDEIVKGVTVCWVTMMAHALSFMHDFLSIASLGFATILGAHGVWQLWSNKWKSRRN